MITHDARWSLSRGNIPVPSPWLATRSATLVDETMLHGMQTAGGRRHAGPFRAHGAAGSHVIGSSLRH